MQKKHWNILGRKKTNIIEQLLKNRGYDSLDQLDNLCDLHDPFLFKQMQRSVKRILDAIKHNQRIMIFGDYDVDGITGASIVIHVLRDLGANFSYRIPNRDTDGYGLSKKFIQEFIDKNVDLLITVDCGISCFDEVELANENNLDVIITDHHHIPEKIPNAYSILHPKQEDCGYPFDDLTGSAVAFKLASALYKTTMPELAEQKIHELLDFASMGTIADMGQLVDENRLIVKRGLHQLTHTKKPGLQALKKLSKLEEKQVSAQDVGFQLSPRINAAGRIGNPYHALFLMIQDAHDQKTSILASKLEAYNNERKEQTLNAIKEAEEKMSEDEDVIILKNPNWSAGILGLIAGRLADKYGKPAFIMQERADDIVGSARCPDFYNVTHALTFAKQHLASFGGHAQAAGFSLALDNYEGFKEALKSYTAGLEVKNQKPTIHVEMELSASDLTLERYHQIQDLAPFGIGNSEPVFLLSNIYAEDARFIGKDQQHLKFRAHSTDVIAFNYGDFFSELTENKIDILVSLELNSWNGNTNLQLRLVDARISS